MTYSSYNDAVLSWRYEHRSQTAQLDWA